MEYDDLIKNVKATLVKAAAEGKKKGVAAGLKKAAEVVNIKVDEFKESLLSELNKIMAEIDSDEEDSSKEK